MMKHVARRVFFLSALYICIIFGIFFIQFTNGRAFSLSLGSMLVSGARVMGDDGVERPELPLHLGVNGLDLYFDDHEKLLAWSSDKSSVALDLIDFGEKDSGFEIRFSGGVSVLFRADRRGDTEILGVTAEMPRKYSRVTIPYRIARSARLEKKDSLTLVSAGKAKYSFSQPQSFTATGTQRLAISRAAPTVYYQTWRPAKGLVIEELAGIPGASDKTLQANVERFAANALTSFRAAINSGTYDEGLAVDYIAEMGRVGMYHAALEAIPVSFSAGSARTWRSSTFLNHLEKTWATFSSEERNERSRLARLLGESNPELFEFPSLLPYLVDRGSSVLFDDIGKFAASIDITAVSSLQAAGILESVLDAPVTAPVIAASLSALSDSCERKLQSSLWRVGDLLYLSDDGSIVDTATTFRVAAVLSRYGANMPGKSAWKYAGNLLASTLLDFAGNRAEFPARFTLTGTAQEKTGIVAKTDRILMPADSYSLIMTSNSWLPHVVSFASSDAPGMWAWTSAKAVSLSRPQPDMLRIETRFPQGETHYMVIRGIKQFRRIQIYGMDFRTDPRFESYNSSGYRYDEETETLYLKMRHKSEYEEVTVWLGAPQTAPVSAGNAAGASQEPGAAVGTPTDSSSPAPNPETPAGSVGQPRVGQ